MSLATERYQHICAHLKPGTKLLLLPSRENRLHWECKTHARSTEHGYVINLQETPMNYIREIQTAPDAAMFIFKPDEYFEAINEKYDWTLLERYLGERDYKLRKFPEGTIYTVQEF